MGEVTWIKLYTDIFENRKMRIIENMEQGDSIFVIWLKLLTLAGDINEDGFLFLTKEIPYNDDLLSMQFRRPLETVQLALDTFEKFGMIEISEGVIRVSNWEKYQNIDGMNRIREQTRKRMKEYRERKKAGVSIVNESCVYCGKPATTIDHIIPKSKNGSDEASNLVPCCKSCNSSKSNKDLSDFLNDSIFYDYQGVNHELVRNNKKLMNYVSWNEQKKRYEKIDVTVTSRYAIEEDIEEDIEKDIEEEKKKNDCQQIADMYNETCVSFPRLTVLSEARKKAIKARLKIYTLNDFKALFEKAEASSFLKGQNARNWSANFDWLIKDSNFAKVLDGNYDDKNPKEEKNASKLHKLEQSYLNQYAEEAMKGESE